MPVVQRFITTRILAISELTSLWICYGRSLEMADFTVHHVENITDVGHLTSDADTGEDKMEIGSRRTGMNAWEMAEFMPMRSRMTWKD